MSYETLLHSQKQDSFSSVFEVTTSAESVSNHDDSLGMDYASIPSEKDISFPSFVSEEINMESMRLVRNQHLHGK